MNQEQILVGLAGAIGVAMVLYLTWLLGIFDWSPRKWFRRGPGDQFVASLESVLDSLLDAKAREWKEELKGFRDLDTLRAEKRALQDRVDGLTVEMDKARRTIDREREEIEFQLGLEKQRRDQEHEFATSKLDHTRLQLEAEKGVAIREAQVMARTEALKVAAEQQGAFLARQEKLIETLTDALPKAEILAKIGNAG